MIKSFRPFIYFFTCTMLCHAQAKKTDQALLNEAREKYDAPFTKNLESFSCAVEFSWKEHFKETTRVGDEGTDEELETIFQPIKNRVIVTRQSVIVSSSLSDADETKLPYGGMAEGLLKHAIQRSLYEWLPASMNMFLPSPDTPASFKRSGPGYRVTYKVQNSEVQMDLDSAMRVERGTLKGPQPTQFGASFASGPQGFLLRGISRFEDGNSKPGHKLSYVFTYQTVEGIQLPEQVTVVRESHHEVWQYKLTGCAVETGK